MSARGVPLVARLSSGGTVLGTLIPAAILVALGAAYLLQGNHSAAPMTASHLLPAWEGPASIVLIVNSFFTYAGVEVNAVHVDELRNPAREYPKSIFVATALVLLIFIGPTLAISWVIPAQQISFTAGVMQAFNSLLGHFGLAFGVPLLAIALVVGFVPPAQFGHSNPLEYGVLILAGVLVIGIVPPLLMDRLRKPGWKAAGGLRGDGLNVSGSQ